MFVYIWVSQNYMATVYVFLNSNGKLLDYYKIKVLIKRCIGTQRYLRYDYYNLLFYNFFMFIHL